MERPIAGSSRRFASPGWRAPGGGIRIAVHEFKDSRMMKKRKICSLK
jgi:hypothetical protein